MHFPPRESSFLCIAFLHQLSHHFCNRFFLCLVLFIEIIFTTERLRLIVSILLCDFKVFNRNTAPNTALVAIQNKHKIYVFIIQNLVCS